MMATIAENPESNGLTPFTIARLSVFLISPPPLPGFRRYSGPDPQLQKPLQALPAGGGRIGCQTRLPIEQRLADGFRFRCAAKPRNLAGKRFNFWILDIQRHAELHLL